MGKIRCSYVNGYHCDCYNRGFCECITYCTYQDNQGMLGEIERLKRRIEELELENEILKNELIQARESRDMYAEIPRQLMSAEEILKHIYK